MPRVHEKWDAVFDQYLKATDLRSPPRVTQFVHVDMKLRRSNRTFNNMTLSEVFAAFDSRAVDAAKEASNRVACDLSRGVSRTTVDALRRAATIAVNGDGHSEVVRLMKEATDAERVTRAKLVGALGVIAQRPTAERRRR